MIVEVSKVYPKGDIWAFNGFINHEKTFESKTKKEAVKGRARFIKHMKHKGLKVLCF